MHEQQELRPERFAVYVQTLSERFYNHGMLKELADLPQWVVWKEEADKQGKRTKVPYSPSAKSHLVHASQKIEASWGTLDQALTFLASGNYRGLGFMLSPNDPFCFIDLDHSYNRQSRQITNPKAGAIIRRIDSYTEASPTDGLHILAKAELPGKGIHTPTIEIYDRVRFFTVTTRHIPGTPITIEERQAEVEELYASLAPVPPEKADLPQGRQVQNTIFLLRGELPPEAENDPVLKTLLAGNTAGYASPSNADFVLIMKLLHWSGDDVSLTKRLFLASPLGQRDKIERRTGETTYIDMTIQNALRKRRNPPMKR